MIYTLTCNPALDYRIHLDEFHSGQVNRTSRESLQAGGKGINVSTVLHHLGVETVALGFIAGFTGAMLSALLKQDNIPQELIMLPEGNTRINIKLITHQETEINGKGACIDEQSLQQLFARLDQMQEGDTLVLAGSIPEFLPDSMYCDIMQKYQEKNIRFAVDASGELLKKTFASHPFLIKPNHHELGELFGVKLHRPSEVIRYAQKVQEWGARNVLVSMAEKGAVLVCEDGEIYQQAAFRGNVVSATGAGDSMLAGFLAAYEKSQNFLNALYLGVSAGSASAFSGELATKEQIAELYRKLVQS